VLSDLINKAFLLSHPDFHIKNLKFIIDTLRDDFLLDFIFENIRKRLTP